MALIVTHVLTGDAVPGVAHCILHLLPRGRATMIVGVPRSREVRLYLVPLQPLVAAGRFVAVAILRSVVAVAPRVRRDIRAIAIVLGLVGIFLTPAVNVIFICHSNLLTGYCHPGLRLPQTDRR